MKPEKCASCGCIPSKKERDIITVSVDSEKLGSHTEHTVVCKQCAIGKQIEFEYAITLNTIKNKQK